MRSLILTGDGRYADPWHPFGETSAAIAEILRGAGFDVTVDSGVDDALAQLSGVNLLVVNAGDPWRGEQQTPSAPVSDVPLCAAIESGIGVLAFHASLSSLRDYPSWAEATGAVWLPGVSFHPPQSDTRVIVHPHPVTDGIEDFVVDDERYCRLQQVGARTVLAEHEEDGVRHPLVWVREQGRSRIAVDLLGHDTSSYSSTDHRRLVRRLALWAVRASDQATPEASNATS